MFSHRILEAEQILVSKWQSNRFQRGSYSNYPILVEKKIKIIQFWWKKRISKTERRTNNENA